jgi:hypothetical protein
MNINVVKQKSLTLFNVLGLLGAFLWVLIIFLRETPVAHHPGINFWLGIAPNFGVTLLLPMLIASYHPVVFERALTRRHFLHGMVTIFAVLLLSEVVHEIFLNSRFDIWDLVASLVGLSIMALVSGKTIILEQETDYA